MSGVVIAASDAPTASEVFNPLGDDLVVWILLALGAAMFVGNVVALVRPPDVRHDDADLERAPRGRSIAMAGAGFVMAVAAFAALVT
jgi:hypothetical protein